jgi:hypothetical protein
MQIWVIELQEWRNLDLEVRMLWLIESEDVINRSKDWHHVAVNLLDDLHVTHDTDFDVSLLDDITARLDKM